MKRMIKRILSVLLVAVMLVGMAPLSGFVGLDIDFGWFDFSTKSSALSSSGSCGTNVTYTFDEDTGLLTISGTGDMQDYGEEESPFYNNSSIKSVVINNGVTSIGDSAFILCTGLTSVTIPDSVTSIGDYTFSHCISLTSITIGTGITSIGNAAFCDCTGLTSITIPDSVTSIGNVSFYRCFSLASIAIPDSLTSIGDCAFYNTGYYTNTNNWENNVLYIGNHLIDTNYEISGSYTIKSGTITIADGAFNNCTGLTSIIIPDGVTNIGNQSFFGCTNLTSIKIPDSVTSIGESAFNNTGYYTNSNNWENKVLYIGNHLIDTNYEISGSYTIKSGTITIADGAFNDCTGLTSITIPDSVKSIGKRAFYCCIGLTSITIPDSVTKIGYGSFAVCAGLTSITIPNSVNSLGDYAFYECTGLTSITIGNGVTSIRNYTFFRCIGLISITIPERVNTIGDYAFYSCNALKDVYYSGTEEQWNAISFGSDNEPLLNANIHYDYSFSEDGMQIVINNTSLAYYEGDDILIAVSNLKNGIANAPDKIALKVSNSKVVKDAKIYNYSDLPKSLKVIDSLKNYKFIYLKANGIGSASVSITDSDTRVSRVIPITVSEDKVATLRASEVKTYVYKNAFEEGDYYNAYCDGIWVSDFEYTEAVGGWNFSMNLYNENYSCGVLEVYDADGNLTQVEIIDKFESLTKGLFKCLEAGYTMVEDFFIEGDTFSFRSDTSAKKTPIENIFVPQGGAIIITADPSVSVSCAVTNAFDVLFTACSCADDIGEFIKGIKSLSTKDAKKITACVLAKAIVQEEYLKFAEEFQKDFCEEVAKNFSLNMINGLASRLFLKANIFLDNLDISFNEVIKMALGSGTDLAEDLFEKCSGPFGITLKSMFIIQDVMDLVCEIKDLKDRSNGSSKFGCYTPIAGEGSNILKRENVVVDTNGNADRGTVLESYIIQSGNKYDDFINNCMNQTNTNYKVYEIAIYNDGTKVQPTEKVTVYIDSPYENATVYRQNEDGTWSKIDSYIKNGMVVFDVDHFCRFIVAEKQYKVNSVSVGDITLNYKKSATITPIIEADEGAEYTVTYTSSNPSVARVDENGKVYGAKKGSAEITVTVTDSYGNSVSDTCKVNVTYAWWQWIIVIVLFGWIWY